MFLFTNGCLFFILFSVEIGVQSQMDVLLKRPSSPHLYKELPSPTDSDSSSIDISPETEELMKRNEIIQNGLKKIGVQMDPEINDQFSVFPHPLNPSIFDHIFDESRQIQDTRAIPNFRISLNGDDSNEDSSLDGKNPLQNLFKFMDDTMPYPPFGPKMSIGPDSMQKIDQKVSTSGIDDEVAEPVGVLTIIRIDDDSPSQDNMFVPTTGDMTNTSVDHEIESSFVQGFLKNFMDAMKDMVDLVHTTNSNGGGNSSHNGTEIPVDIKIKDHGKTYDIPPNAYIERSDPNIVNITWRSEQKGLNNSLCMNVSKDEDGLIVFNHIRLRILNGQSLQEYNLEDPVRVGKDKNNSTEINLADGVGLDFPHPDSLDVIVVEKRGKFSTQWLAVSIALLGLIVAGLIMLLSYILHSRNRYYARKDSITKQPIA